MQTEHERLTAEKQRLTAWLDRQFGHRSPEKIRNDKRYLRLLVVIERLRVLDAPAAVVLAGEEVVA